MKTQLSEFYSDHKMALKTIILFLLIAWFPFISTLYGIGLYCIYLWINLIAVLPALGLSQFIFLAMPPAACNFVSNYKSLRSFKGKRKLLKNALEVQQKLN